MQDFLSRISQFSPKRLALLADELQHRVEELEGAQHEPIAIIGIGCRMPGGADTPARFWELLRDGRDAIVEVPPERWRVDDCYDPDPDAAGMMATRWGGFLSRVDQFDAPFFGVSPREAHAMDPQQRLLLEVAWEALEHAGIPADRLAGSRTGVFVGVSGFDYYQLIRSGGLRALDAYTASGTAHSIASGRLSYVLGVQGPSVSIDTACSSSLVAVHQAVQSLRRGESTLALAAGVNLMLAPDVTIALSRAHMMAPDGRCKVFDARADGFVRGEGCGVLVLKRLSAAVTDGDRIIALIRGSAVNQDGRSNGLTAPNGPSQERVIRDALVDARLAPSDVGYVEAHGTGTALGDPIEVQALAHVLGEGRAASAPLWIGSVKANIGHLEAAAGVAGLIKLALVLQQREVPGQIQYRDPNPAIPWSELPVRVPTAAVPWSAAPRPRVGGVSSFGFSGTNVHVVLEEAPETSRPAAAMERPLHLLTASAHRPAALLEVARSRAEVLAAAVEPLADVAYTANAGRAHLAHRLAVIAPDAAAAAARLEGHLRGDPSDGVLSGAVPPRAPKIAFLFTGQGSQYAGMARELYETQPTFRAALDRCDELLAARLPRRLLSVLFPGPADATLLDATEYTQPALFAVEFALARMWMDWGIQPSVVLGHSVGEYVAACVAGVFSLEDGLALIAERGRLMGALPAGGGMAAVMASEARVAPLLRPWAHEVAVAAVNGPDSVVLSGRLTALGQVMAALGGAGIKVTPLKVSHAFHSPLVEPMLDNFARAAAEVAFTAPQIDLVSNVTGQLVGAPVAHAAYWRDHVRAPVQFAAAVQTLSQRGCDVLLEVGPQPTLLGMARECLPAHEGAWLPSLRRGRGDWESLLDSLASLYVRGAEVDWARFDAGYSRRKVILPGYPFQRERYFVSAPSGAPAPADGESAHPVLGREVLQSVSDDRLFENRLDPAVAAYLEDHRILGSLLLPSPVHMEMALAAGARLFGAGPLRVGELLVREGLTLVPGSPATLQLAVTPPRDGIAEFRISSLAAETRTWRLHATGTLAPGSVALDATESITDIEKRLREPVDVERYYEWLGSLGLELGPRFRGVERIVRRDGEVLAAMRLPEALAGEAAQYWLHPALFDACFHVIGATMPTEARASAGAFLLLGVDRLCTYGRPGERFFAHVSNLRAHGQDVTAAEAFRVDIRLLDEAGGLHAEFEGVQLKRARAESGVKDPVPAQVRRLLHEVVWRDLPRAIGRLSSPSEIGTQVGPQVEALRARHGLEAYAEFLPALDALAATYVVQALRELGFDFVPGTRLTAASLGARLGVLPSHGRLMSRMLTMLVEDSILLAEGDGLRVVAAPPATDPEGAADALRARFPDCEAELEVTRAGGRVLAQVLRGSCDPLGVLFPNGSLALMERLYQESPPARAYNALVAQVVRTAVAAAPSGQPVRILEIGAGTGSTTAHVLPALEGINVEYMFTDVSPLFLNRARAKFGGRDDLRYALLDIGRDPAEQDLPEGQFDVVLAANVLHATADLGITLGHVRKLLVPGGLLVMLEATAPQRFADLTVGLLPGWWAYTDVDRRDYALMPRRAWSRLLAERGFDDVVAIPGETPDAVLSQQAVMVSQARAEAADRPARWLIVPDAGDFAHEVVQALRGAGEAVEVLPPGDAVERGTALASALASGRSCRGVLHLAALDAALHPATTADTLMLGQERLVRSLLGVVRVLAGQAGETVPPLWLVTRGAQAAAADEGADPAQAVLWGMSHSVAIEHPDLRCRRVDLDPAVAATAAAHELVRELLVPSAEDQLALRGERRLVRRLVPRPVESEPPDAVPSVIRSDRSYLVTGGLRGLGLRVAEWLVECGARHVTLMGRRAPDAATTAAIGRMEAAGARMVAVQGDVGEQSDVQRVLALIGETLPPLAGVVHAAGVLDDGLLTTLSWPRFATVMGPKVLGTWLLHTLTTDLDFLVLFSSGASVAGGAGLANHAAANAFEDAMAWHRQARGLPTLSINWGAWAEIGAAAVRGVDTRGLLRSISPPDGLAALAHALRRPVTGGPFRPPQLAVLAVDWTQLDGADNRRSASRLFSELRPAAHAAAPRHEAGSTGQANLREQLGAASPNRRRTLLRDHVRQLTVQVLGVRHAHDLDVNEPLRQLGLDSLMAVELRNLLSRAVGRKLPATVTFDHPSVAALVDYLAQDILAQEMGSAVAPAPATPVAISDEFDALTDREIAQRLSRHLDSIGTSEAP